MYNRETLHQNKKQIIPGLRDAFCLNLSQGAMRILVALILIFSTIIPSTGQELVTEPASAESEGLIGVPLWDGSVNGDGDRSITNPAPYCTSTSGGTLDNSWITRVHLGGIDNYTGKPSSPFYTYYNDKSTDLLQGNSYTITLAFASDDESYGYGEMAVWIDFDQNKNFSSDEKLGFVLRRSGQRTIAFRVPCDAAPGITRMRVREFRGNDGGNPINHYPCDKSGYGETQDYNVNILPLVNNTLSLSNSVSGTICATVNENLNATMTAPAGSAFVHVDFASYGTPNGSCNSFTYGYHAPNSFPVTETYLLGKNSATIPATNTVYGDPIVGAVKRLYVQAVYAEPICEGSSPGEITGSLPGSDTGTFTYLWESSTTNATSGFTVSSGINNQKNYTPGNLSKTTWFRRNVTSGGCESTSRVMVIYVMPAITNNNISAPQTIGAGETPATLKGSNPAGGNGSYTYLWERSTTNATAGFSACSGTNNAVNYSPPALTQTTWFRRTVISGGCTDVSGAVQITISRLWKGTLSTDFATADNWTNNSVPPPGENIVFDPAPLNDCKLDGPRTVGNITNAQSAHRLVANGHTLTITGNLLLSNGAQIEAGTSSSTLNFAGNGPQTIPAEAIYNNEVYNLTVNNTANVALLGTLNIKGTLIVIKGVLNINNNLTLLSTADQTALIDGSGMGHVNGNVTMQRYLPKGFGYKYLSSPMQNATVAELGDDMDLTASFPPFYNYDESKTSSGWNSYIVPTNPLLPLIGYCVNFGTNANPVTADIKGKVNNGIVGPLALFNHNMQFTQGFNLAGNPYPSPVDWSAVNGWSKINVDDAVYYFNAGDTNQYVGTYTSYVNGMSSDGSGGTSNIIPSMQGFFVHVSDGTQNYPVSGSLQVNNQARVNDLSPAFHKNAERDFRPLVRLNVKFEGQNSREDFLAIYFDYGATKRFEKELDALKIYNTDADVPNLFAVSEDDRRLSIGAYPQLYDETLEIPLGIKTDRSGNVTLRLELQENIPTGFNVYLKDKATGAVQDLSRVSVYSLPAGNGLMEGRLSLVFSSSDLSQDSFGNNSFNVYAQDGWLFVKIQLKETQANLRLANMAGQVLLQQNIYGEGSHRLSSAPPPGVYLVTVYTDQGILSKKIYLQ